MYDIAVRHRKTRMGQIIMWSIVIWKDFVEKVELKVRWGCIGR